MIKEIFRKFHSQVREFSKKHLRSSKWNEIRDEHLKNNPSCAACGSKKKIQVHHILPFRLNPELELEKSNLISLCMDKDDCHINIGHGDSFRFYNPDVAEDSKKFLSSTPEKRKALLESIKKKRLRSS